MEIRRIGTVKKNDFIKTVINNSLNYLRDERTTYIDYVEVQYKKKDVLEYQLVPVIKYKLFDGFDNIICGFSTRYGGVSTEHLSSMNLSFTRGDKEKNVIDNHKIFAKAVGYDYKKLVLSDQVHDIIIKSVTEEDAGKGISKKTDIKGIDGLITDIPGIPLMTFYADCVPLFFYDPVKKVVATAHSGWKGTVNKIGTVMIDKMVNEYSCNVNDIYCAIGPSICQACYEVSEDVAIKFKENYANELHNELLIDKGNGKYQLDLHKACYYNFIAGGVNPEHIAMPDLCTCCNSDFLFSHRKTNGKRGNLSAVIMLK